MPERRLPEPVEAAAYYVVAEALANVHKHAGAARVVVRATADDGAARRRGRRRRRAAAPTREGSGLRGLADRVEALGGRLVVESPEGGGTLLRAEMPRRPTAPSAEAPALLPWAG